MWFGWLDELRDEGLTIEEDGSLYKIIVTDATTQSFGSKAPLPNMTRRTRTIPTLERCPKLDRAPPANRVQDAADRAEIMTLEKEIWRLRDKLDHLAMYLREAAAEGGRPACCEVQVLTAARET